MTKHREIPQKSPQKSFGEPADINHESPWTLLKSQHNRTQVLYNKKQRCTVRHVSLASR